MTRVSSGKKMLRYEDIKAMYPKIESLAKDGLSSNQISRVIGASVDSIKRALVKDGHHDIMSVLTLNGKARLKANIFGRPYASKSK
jgi:hypothetical protein